jgi:WD40 repeat protein
MSGSVRPTSDAWVAAIHSSESDDQPLGTAVVVDPVRLLTSAHVVKTQIESELSVWVSFPKADNPFGPRQRVSVRIAPEPKADLAVLELSHPIPAGVEVARLRSPRPHDLVGHHWWAFGFPENDPFGNSADGTVGEALGYGWVRLDTKSSYLVERGFSGGGLWSDYGDGAVVGIVGQANDRGDGRALALYFAALAMPDEKLEDLTRWSAEASGLVALQSWGWSLTTDPEAIRHWRPRARGVAVESEVGYRFRGRRNALQRIVAWLDRPTPDGRVLAVTGSPGVGKSAVLGRIVTTADPQLRGALPTDDTAVKAPLGSIGCAVHAKGKTALEVAREIAAAASAPIPDQVEDFAPLIRQGLIDHHRQRFNVIVDAVDEAQSTSEARLILTKIVLNLSQSCADVGANLVVGTRTHDSGGNLVNRLGAAAIEVKLDDPQYSSIEDLTDYAIATLQLLGNERADNPYAAVSVAAPVARRIATLADGNYLVAGLVGRTHGQYDRKPADPSTLTFDSSVDDAFGTYLQRVPPFQHITATDLLTPLAYAEAPGFTAELWQAALGALTGHVLSATALARFAATAAAAFVVQASETGTATSYRLFHQALSEALVKTRVEEGQSGDEEALTRTFLALGKESGWHSAPPYLLRSLPGHAQRAGLVDHLLVDDSFLLHADLRRVIPAGSAAVSARARDRLRLLRLSNRAIDAEPRHRESIFSVTAALHGLTRFRTNEPHVPYRSVWAHAAPTAEFAVLEGHTGWVNAVCAVTVDGRQLVASAGDDRVMRLWDPASGAEVRTLQGHTGAVRAVCAMTVDSRQLVASAGDDRVVRLWDPASGAGVRTLPGHAGGVNGVCAVTVDGRQLVASAGYDQVVRLWDPATGAEVRALQGHAGPVRAVCAVTVDGRQLVVSAGNDPLVQLWDPANGAKVRALPGHAGGVNGVCAVTVDGRQLVASAGDGWRVRLWDPANGATVWAGPGHAGGVNGVCAVTVDGRQLVASAGDDRVVRLWDPASGAKARALQGHAGPVRAVCAVTVDGRQLLISAGQDQLVRLWDPANGAEVQTPEDHTNGVNAVCAVSVDGRQLVASAADDQLVRLWDPTSGAEVRALQGHTAGVNAVCAVMVHSRQLLASAGYDLLVRLWDPANGAQVRTLQGHTAGVKALCAVTVEGGMMLASAGNDRLVQLWDPANGAQVRTLQGHAGRVNALCAVTVDGTQLLASVGDDQLGRLWDPANGTEVRMLRGHIYWVNAVCAVTVDGRQLLASAGDDWVVRLWDPANGAEVRALQGHASRVNAVCAVTVDGRQLLASAGDDWVVQLWDPASGELQYSIHIRIRVRSLIALGTGTLIAASRNGLIALSLHLPQ